MKTSLKLLLAGLAAAALITPPASACDGVGCKWKCPAGFDCSGIEVTLPGPATDLYDVSFTWLSTSASYNDLLYVKQPGGWTYLFDNQNHTESPVVLSFAGGTTLHFMETTPFDVFYSGPDHPYGVRVAEDPLSATVFNLGFEDLRNPACPEPDYNDVIIQLSYTRTGPGPVVPEPETYAMMLAGLGLMGFMVRRRNAA